ncbi:MAG: tRNA(adenine34) deaminase [Candidatus Deianiraeaceae bacterium]|jgi:tRNA(adenine34) deaminase
MFKNYQQLALQESKNALKNGEVPVGAVAVCDGVVIARAYNRSEEHRNKTLHAEMVIIDELRKIYGNTHFFGKNISIYVTLEPCCMCLSAMSMCGIKCIYYMLEDVKFGGVSRIFTESSSYFKPDIYYIYNEEYHVLLKEFFENIRNS